ncbi:homoserine dehydrogenase [Geomicrobium sp. JCM 19039]|uniref:homoserine dehydrogenase n=1 Tax=Geomicrobium sp. JCM 19039 TaxID=1460636 RepID=UPI00045F3D45|nr:homoserine dehydrogenase [Geomicrobium sp. JCM 19039]GAK14696.1 homoserine dehydrogenase [Geomicrobium sp. JCM 19039]
MSSKQIVVGLLGLGTVGSGMMHILTHHKEKLQTKTGAEEIIVRKVLVRDPHKERDQRIAIEQFTTDGQEVVTDPDIDIIIEVMGGIDEAKKLIETALNQGKHVVTANKDLLALHGEELLKKAQENNCLLLYEASVAGGIPILRTLNEGLVADHITKMIGIVNGTTNYMLTKMSKEDLTYDEALKEAQEKGFAESDPTADVGGLDAARKMVILSRLGFSESIDLDRVYVRGMTGVAPEDIDYGKQLGFTMKLIGLASRNEGELEVSVEPVFVPNDHPLASVNDEYNAVYVYGEAVGETMFYGPGAGSLPTASAIASDFVNVARHVISRGSSRIDTSVVKRATVKEVDDVEAKFYVRLYAQDVRGAFKTITSQFTAHGVSFEKLMQSPLDTEEKIAEVVIVTHETTRGVFDQLIDELNGLNVVDKVMNHYRVEGGVVNVLEEQDIAIV